MWFINVPRSRRTVYSGLLFSLSGVTPGYSSFSDHRSIESRSISSTGSQPNFDRPGNKYCAGTRNKQTNSESARCRPQSARCRYLTPRDYFPSAPLAASRKPSCVARQFNFFSPQTNQPEKSKTISIFRYFKWPLTYHSLALASILNENFWKFSHFVWKKLGLCSVVGNFQNFRLFSTN